MAAGLLGCVALTGCSNSEADPATPPTSAVVALSSDPGALDDAGVACVDALKARYPGDRSPLLRDYTTAVEGANYATRGYVDVLAAGGMNRYRIVCTTTVSGGDYSSTVSEAEQVPYVVEPEPTRSSQPTPTRDQVDARDAEIAFRAGLIRVDFPGRDNPDLIRRAKNVCRQLDAGDSLTSVGETLQGQNPDWSTRQAGQFAGVAIGAFCQEHRSLLPG
ncbi:DUF732 domain-containing protein [Prescottella equi]|uniref:DUF732 domain-containing protein n=1 Tax=Rhodococcus hoagii TaxID=43767 RepID=UPI001982414F|nr:DUF732 domain-containing protein [Prescottella equi]